MDTVKISGGAVKMIAHRGLSAIECENTNAAFVAAGNRSYFGIETDIHVTSDGKFAVIHDDITTRVSNVNKIVEKNTFETLSEIPLQNPRFREARGDLRIPELKEYLGICKKYGKTAVIELKNRMAEDDIANIIKECNNFLRNIIFISFSWENLISVKKMLPKQKVQYLTMICDDELIERLKENNMDLDIEYTAVTRELTEKLHKNGIELNCWTCDSKEEAEKLISWGVDYITSNMLE